MSDNHKLTMIGTGISYGALVSDDHAAIAVQNALAKMRPCKVGSVLLFLTSAFAQHPQNAIKAAIKAAGTPQVSGCCATGLLCDQEWLLDAEGAVAMVFPQEFGLQPNALAKRNRISPNWCLTLSSPNAAAIAVNSISEPQFGALASDEFGHGPFSVWQSGRLVEREFCHSILVPPGHYEIAKAEGIRRISPVMQVNRSIDNALIELDQRPAVDNIMAHMPNNLRALGSQEPYNLLAAVSENSDRSSIEKGHYKLLHIVSIDKQNNQLRLSGNVKAGRYLFWAVRDEKRAQEVMHSRLLQTKQQFAGEPKFALMFPNISRGAEFYNGRDRDFELFHEVFPELPMIGFYGHGEITPGHHLAGLIHHYSTVFGIFS